MTDLVAQLLEGNRRALARLLTQVENEAVGVQTALAALYPHTGRAHIIGVTGAPGTGKSTLVNALTKAWRAQHRTVGILAVDPTSPFTDGAILGDRIRMRDLAGDPGVFIRSMATRGEAGGLARACRDAIRVLDAAGFEMIAVETVGAGQNEVDVANAAQTIVVVDAPGMGDDVQAIKAGILEIADVLVVNKADRPESANTVRTLKAMLELGHPAAQARFGGHQGWLLASTDETHRRQWWRPPIVPTVATTGEGIADLIEAIATHKFFLDRHDLSKMRERRDIEIELYDRLQRELMVRLVRRIPEDVFGRVIERVQAREIDPHQAVLTILDGEEQDDISNR